MALQRLQKVVASFLAAAEQFGVEMNAQLQADVRKIIDETNRKYRDELKIRKYRKGSVEGTILQHNDDNELD